MFGCVFLGLLGRLPPWGGLLSLCVSLRISGCLSAWSLCVSVRVPVSLPFLFLFSSGSVSFFLSLSATVSPSLSLSSSPTPPFEVIDSCAQIRPQPHPLTPNPGAPDLFPLLSPPRWRVDLSESASQTAVLGPLPALLSSIKKHESPKRLPPLLGLKFQS